MIIDELAAATYYEFAPVRMETVGLLAALMIVVLSGHLLGVVSSPTIAGALSIAGVAMVVNTAIWAWTVPPSLVMQFPVDESFTYHRGALVILATSVLLTGFWFVEQSLSR
ncbi:hypothetical protein ACFQMM_09685 [Saliphagus sp. GCM10025308]